VRQPAPAQRVGAHVHHVHLAVPLPAHPLAVPARHAHRRVAVVRVVGHPPLAGLVRPRLEVVPARRVLAPEVDREGRVARQRHHPVALGELGRVEQPDRHAAGQGRDEQAQEQLAFELALGVQRPLCRGARQAVPVAWVAPEGIHHLLHALVLGLDAHAAREGVRVVQHHRLAGRRVLVDVPARQLVLRRAVDVAGDQLAVRAAPQLAPARLAQLGQGPQCLVELRVEPRFQPFQFRQPRHQPGRYRVSSQG